MAWDEVKYHWPEAKESLQPTLASSLRTQGGYTREAISYWRYIDGSDHPFAQTPRPQRNPEIERVGHTPSRAPLRQFFVP